MISRAELFNIIDYWYYNRTYPNVTIETKKGNILQGVASTGTRIPEYLKESRPTIIYINGSQEVLIDNIKTLQYDGCHYVINEE